MGNKWGRRNVERKSMKEIDGKIERKQEWAQKNSAS
jgi:hypothetical protein